MIKDYHAKGWHCISRQNYVCGLCGGTIDPHTVDGIFYDNIKREKLDLCHDFPRTKLNQKNYPLFIDSVENLAVGHNSCNVRRIPLNYRDGVYNPKGFITFYQADQWEIKMRSEK